MKKISLILFTVMANIQLYSQNTMTVTVDANNIRIWSKPTIAELVTNTFLKFGERIRIIDAIIEDNENGRATEKFCRVYRPSISDIPYYLNISEFSLDTRNQRLMPAASAATQEVFIDSIWTPLSNTFHKKGEIIFFDGKNLSGIYSFLNKAAFNKSERINNKFTGFYKIHDIVKYKVENNEKVFFYCRPLHTPFNENVENNIYLDFFEARNSIDFQSLSHVNFYFNLLLNYAYEESTNNENYYTKYLISLYGKENLLQMDEFKRARLFASGKQLMDSVFNKRMRVFEMPLSDVFYSEISDYDFNTNSFKISELPNAQNELTPLVNKFSSKRQRIDGFINLPEFSSNLQMNVDQAEKFLKEIKAHILNPYDYKQGREIILIAHFKYISVKKAKALYKKYDTHITNFNFQKVIDSIEVLSGKGFTREDVVVTKTSLIPDKRETKKWGTLYPKSLKNLSIKDEDNVDNPNSDVNTDDKIFTKVDRKPEFPGGNKNLIKYIKNKIGSNHAFESGQYSIKLIIDSDGTIINIEALTMKGTNLSKIINEVILKGPKWTPGSLNNRYIRAFCEQEITYPFND